MSIKNPFKVLILFIIICNSFFYFTLNSDSTSVALSSSNQHNDYQSFKVVEIANKAKFTHSRIDFLLERWALIKDLKEGLKTACIWSGYQANHFTRKLGRDIERVTRPFKYGEKGYCETPFQELTERIKRVTHSLICLPASILGVPLSILFSSIANSMTDLSIQVIYPENEIGKSHTEKQISIISLNSCFQEGPFAPITGGVVPPFDPVGKHPSRVAAVAHWIGSLKVGPNNSSPDVFLGQEIHDLNAQTAFIEELKKLGYCYFIVDRTPHPVFMNSGLFVASKKKIGNVSFISFPFKDRAGLAMGSKQGALCFSILDENNKEVLRIFNTQLNYGYGPDCQAARNRQLAHIIPHLNNSKIPTILAGDLNFDTSGETKKDAGLEGFTNIYEGKITCTSEGTLLLRGAAGEPEFETIDGIVTNHQDIQFSDVKIEKLELEGYLLSDHYALEAIIDLSFSKKP